MLKLQKSKLKTSKSHPNAPLSCAILVGVLLLGGCENQEAPSPVTYESTASVHDFMYWMLEPAADVIWDSAGFVITEDGEVDLQPTTQEGWDAVRNAATVVAESGNLLSMPGYRADEEDWVEYSQALIRTGLAAREAAQNKDADALFDAGGAIYNVCRACHNRYVIAPGE